MRSSSIPWARTAPTSFASRTDTSFFTWLLESMHRSRGLEAQRFLRTNRHLIADRWDSGLDPNTGDDDNDTR